MSDTTSISITIQLHGVFRRYLNGQSVTLILPNPVFLEDIVMAFSAHLKQHHHDFDDTLLSQSVFANHTDILLKNPMFKQDTILSVLPPVCGG